jgi:hypothetical protein
VPLNAPWSKAAEVIDYVREVRPATVIDIHDGLLNGTGVGLYGKVVGALIGTERRHLDTGGAQQV